MQVRSKIITFEWDKTKKGNRMQYHNNEITKLLKQVLFRKELDEFYDILDRGG